MRKLISVALLCFVFAMSRPRVFAQEWKPLPQWNDLFQNNTQGFLGADGAYSIRLSPTTVLWMFGDSLIGKRKAGKRTDVSMVNNTLALQIGNDPASATVRFYWNPPEQPKDGIFPTPQEIAVSRSNARPSFEEAGAHGAKPGKPRPFFTPESPGSWFWPFDAAKVQDGLAVFLMKIEKTPEGGILGFRQVGSTLAWIDSPHKSPKRWRPKYSSIPFSKVWHGKQRFYGSSVMTWNGFLYIYGHEEITIPSPPVKHLILARAPLSSVSDFSTWTFFDGQTFQANAEAVARLATPVPSEFTVRKVQGGFELFQSWGNHKQRGMFRRTAPHPWGPWSKEIYLGNCEEENWDKTFCYSAKAHPHLSAPAGKEIFTYCTNSSDFWKMLEDTRIYYPRFIEIAKPFPKAHRK